MVVIGDTPLPLVTTVYAKPDPYREGLFHETVMPLEPMLKEVSTGAVGFAARTVNVSVF